MTSTIDRTPVKQTASPDAALLADAVETVIQLSQATVDDNGASDQAASAMARLRLRWSDVRLDLLHDREVDGTVSYDLLIRGSAGTVSVAFSPAPAAPWPLRGAMHYTENKLLRVGTTELGVGEAVGALDYLWDNAGVLSRLIDTCIIKAELEREPIHLDDTQIQQATDAFRRAKGLLTAEQTTRWLDAVGLDQNGFVKLVTHAATAAALRQRVTAGRIESWLAEHRDELATLTVAWIAATGPDGSAPLPADRTAALTVVAEAIQHGQPAGVLHMSAGEAPQELRSVTVGQPVTTAVHGTPARAVVLERLPAELDDDARRYAERAMFDQWLADVRARADIEWFWLDIERTAAVAP
ncbi:TIGR04500 family putative peptide maturation system protein [Micromonospora sp. NBC_01638]|uniref:TIGR04500 family putative peptide maturation system protein n=1 Tax=Micromonospora sp. NBC_01638 TaxID=2975982 RepID=UPI003866FBBE|nr:TIGR04500 family putative peptide maturation system protein [Micromonospora sp. NBC_01638]